MAQQYSTRWLVGGVVALAALVLLAPLLFGGTGWGGMAGGMGSGMWGPMHDGSMMDGTWGGTDGWWLLVAALWRLLVLAAIVGGGYLLYRALAGDGVAGTSTDPAIRELRNAYARGDLSEEEFERRRERLEKE